MTSPKEYRQYAADCVRVAQQIDDTNDKATLLQMATIWLGLAAKAERQTVPTAENVNGDV